MKKEIIIALIIGLLLGGFAGYIFGYSAGLSKAVDIGVKILQVDDKVFKDILLNYQGKIKILFDLAGVK